MIINEKLIPLHHPNRIGDKLTGMLAYIVHSTANFNPGTGDTWHANYFGRAYEIGPYFDIATGKIITGNLEKGTIGQDKAHPGCGIKFRNGATHSIADEDSITMDIPLDEYAPGAGDRPKPYDNQWKGQNPIASYVFGNMQNYKSLQIEICDSGDWKKSMENARQWIIQDAKARSVRIDMKNSLDPINCIFPPIKGTVLILRHYDVTSKNCPSRLVKDYASWGTFVESIVAEVNT
jgi:hypothetical protein